MLLLLTACMPEGYEGPFLVTRIIDGDTLEIENGEIIRLSGINTPEKKECYYEEAKQALSQLTINKSVYLERDLTDRGKYKRLIRYVYVGEEHVNALLVLHGYAKVYDKYAFDTKRYNELKKIEKIPRAQGMGVWSCSEKPLNK